MTSQPIKKRKGGFPKGTKVPRLKDAEKELFCKVLEANGGRLVAAARTVGRDLATFHRARENDRAFAEAVDLAMRRSTSVLEDVALKRATEGWEEPVYFKGEVIGSKQKFSDTLLIFMLKSRDPKYRDNVHTFQGPGGGPILIEEEEKAREKVINELQAAAERAVGLTIEHEPDE